MSVLSFVQNNTPRAKPELWSNMPRALLRHAAYLWWRIAAPAEWRPHPVTFDGNLRIYADPRDATVRPVYFYGIREYPTTHLLHRLLRPGMRFFDIGAHIGYYSLLAAKRVGAAGLVASFEPVSRLCDLLQLHASLNRFTHIRVHQVAMSDREGPVVLHVSQDPGATGLSSLREGWSKSMPTQVEGATLDGIIERHYRDSPPDVLKIDVEGAEPDVLKGARNLLQEQAPMLIIECLPGSTALEQLVGMGYRIYLIDMLRGAPCLVPSSDSSPRRPSRTYEAPNYFALKASGGELPLPVVNPHDCSRR